jgi:hypothetical protein
MTEHVRNGKWKYKGIEQAKELQRPKTRKQINNGTKHKNLNAEIG